LLQKRTKTHRRAANAAKFRLFQVLCFSGFLRNAQFDKLFQNNPFRRNFL